MDFKTEYKGVKDLSIHVYYPEKYQTGEYEKYSYYIVIDGKKTLSVDMYDDVSLR